MAETKSIEINCTSCKSWFPSPIMIGGDVAFAATTLINNKVRCPACGVLTGCDKENMRVKFSDGGFKGIDT